MPPLAEIFPTLPWPATAIILNVIAGLGAILVTYAIFLEAERKQDAVMFVGAAFLFIYAYWIGNKIFMVATAGVFIASLVEFIEIMFGHHEHSNKMLDDYKCPSGNCPHEQNRK